MKSHRLVCLFVLAAACLLLASCIDSKHPLSDPEKAKADAELAGVWRVKPDSGDVSGNVEYYHVGKAGDKLPAGVMRVVTVGYAKDGTLPRPGELLAFSTSVGENRYLNIAFIDGKDIDQFAMAGWKPTLVQGYIVAKYQVQGDVLTLWGLDPDAKRRVIEAGKIKGTIEKNSVFFTDTSENIAALLSDPKNANLFAKEPTKYERVK